MDNIYKGQLNLKFLKMEDLNKGLVLKNIKS